MIFFWFDTKSKGNRNKTIKSAAATAAKSLQLCPTLCDPIDGSPPGSPIPGILQPRTLEWGAISFSNAWKWKVKVKSLSHVWLLVTLWTAAYQAPLSMGFSRQEFRSGVPLPSPKDKSVLIRQLTFFQVIATPWTGKITGVGYHCLLWNITLGKCKSKSQWHTTS